MEKLTFKTKDILGIFIISLVIITLASGIYTGKTLWSLFDFVLMSAMLSATGFLLVFVNKKLETKNRKYFLTAIIILAFLLVWAELAVGLFNTPFAGN